MLKFGKSGSYASLNQYIVYSADWRIRVRLFEAPFDHRRSFGIQPGLTQKSDQFLCQDGIATFRWLELCNGGCELGVLFSSRASAQSLTNARAT